jgi:hypothetical protein
MTGQIRLRIYLVSSALATLIFLLFVFLLMMVPGVPPVQKIWMLSIAAIFFSVPLVIGTWKFNTTEAPLTVWPVGTVVFVILMLEMAVCLINIVDLVLIVHRYGFDYAP